MDSITHIALGACIGEAALSGQTRKKALIIGAIAQSLPDIDVIASLWLSPADNLLAHRGLTHSFLFGIIAAIVLSFLAQKLLQLRDLSFMKLFVFFCLQIWLHDVLDTCNAYGTGLFEPFSHKRFSFHLLFVADPLFSVSPVIACIALLFFRKDNQTRKKWLFIGLFPTSLYLLYTVYNKMSVNEQAEKSLQAKGIMYKNYIATPTPFNTLLWYIVAATDSGYVVGYRSVFDRNDRVTPFTYYPRNERLLQGVDKMVNVKQLLVFADGYYTVEDLEGLLVFNVLRFGQVLGWQDSKAHFAFQYFLSPSYDNTLVVQRGRFRGWNRKTIIRMYERIKGN